MSKSDSITDRTEAQTVMNKYALGKRLKNLCFIKLSYIAVGQYIFEYENSLHFP